MRSDTPLGTIERNRMRIAQQQEYPLRIANSDLNLNAGNNIFVRYAGGSNAPSRKRPEIRSEAYYRHLSKKPLLGRS